MSIDSETDDSTLGVAFVSLLDEESSDADDLLAGVEALIESAGHEVAIHERIDAAFDAVQATVSRLADRGDVDAVLVIGGVDVNPDADVPGAVRPLLDAKLPAFETLFTTHAAETIGTDVLSLRPLGGIMAGVPVFCIPDDDRTVDLAMSELICPQLQRLVDLARPDEAEPKT